MDIRTQRTRAALKDAFLTCLKEKPVMNISAADISRRAGVNRATFYQHYKSVDDMVTELENEQLTSFRNLMKTKDLFGEELIQIILDQLQKGNEINKTAMVSYFSEHFTNDLADIAKELAFDAWKSRMPTAADQEIDLALSTVISTAVLIVKEADKYSRETIVRFISNLINGLLKMYE